MYEGFMGPFELLRPFVETDGEASAHRVAIEMIVNAYVFFLLIWLFMKRKSVAS